MVFGSASVMLIATLESLTVDAGPMALVAGKSGREPFADADSVAITTTWAVPANLTTIHMVLFAGGGSADEFLDNKWKRNPVATPLQNGGRWMQPPGPEVDLNAGAEARTIYAQGAGATNQAFTRTDYLHFENNPQAPRVEHSKPDHGSLSVVVQAL